LDPYVGSSGLQDWNAYGFLWQHDKDQALALNEGRQDDPEEQYVKEIAERLSGVFGWWW
jgi:hypothetical protein